MYNNKELRKKKRSKKKIKTLFVVCSSRNAHKINVSQTGFTQFQGVIVSGEKVIIEITLSVWKDRSLLIV